MEARLHFLLRDVGVVVIIRLTRLESSPRKARCVLARANFLPIVSDADSVMHLQSASHLCVSCANMYVPGNPHEEPIHSPATGRRGEGFALNRLTFYRVFA